MQSNAFALCALILWKSNLQNPVKTSKQRQKLIAASVSEKTFISVVIPVRDEAEVLRKTLKSFVRQIDQDGRSFDENLFELIVLLNNCRDDSAQIARSFQKENRKLNLHICEMEIPPKNANSGYVRRLLMDEAFFRLTQNGQTGGIIMTTDGDTQIANDWLAANLAEIRSGADAVGGRILFSDDELAKMNPAVREIHLVDEKYHLLAAELEASLDFLPHDPSPRHHQHFNGSFAVKAEIYGKVGGIPNVRFLEDVAFYEKLLHADAKFRHSLRVKVFTSARNTGRTEAGLSTQINDWKIIAERGENFLVESADALCKKFEMQGKLRRLWQNSRKSVLPADSVLENLADECDVCIKYLREEIEKRQTCGNFLESIRRRQTEKRIENLSLVPVGDAVEHLKILIEKVRIGNNL